MDNLDKNHSELTQEDIEQYEKYRENRIDKKALLLGVALAMGIILIMLCQFSILFDIFSWTSVY